MLKVNVYNLKGEKTTDLELNPEIFGVKLKKSVVHQVVVGNANNRRQVLAHTKTRSEVRGGGKKPWKQKGTGRARHGSIRSPLWVGGGVIFGPNKNRNFTQKINARMKRKALFMCLSEKVMDNKLVVLEDLRLATPKTKEMVGVLKNLKIQEAKNLVALNKISESVKRGIRNLKNTKLVGVNSLNVEEILYNNYLVTTVAGIGEIEKIYKINKK